ncbi:MAG: hypothetical protein HFJ41_01910 [Clostridia bacterium]|nr:hypothetical protein [Clostridia bacterium]
MLKEQMSKLKDIFKNNEGNNKKKIENLVVFVIILIITIIVINMILKDDKKEGNTETNSIGKTLAKTEEPNYTNTNDELKENLEKILSKIDGVGKANVLITYSQSSEKVAMYNEDSTKSDTEESDSRWAEIEK